MLKEVEVVSENEKDPAWNCLVGTEDDIPCPVCGSHAWKRYGAEQHIACRKCGKQILTRQQQRAAKMIWGIVIATFVIALIIFLCIIIGIAFMFFYHR